MKKIPTLALALGLLALERSHAFNPQPEPPGFGMIALAAGQTLRLNVSNIQLPANRAYPPDPCRVELSFFDGAGNALVPAVQKTLSPGVSTHIDLNGDDIVGRDLLRIEVRPAFRFVIDPSGLPPGPCVSSIELMDNQSGQTLIVAGPQNPGTIRGFNPQPDPPGVVGLVGLLPRQTARLNAVNSPVPGPSSLPPGPCRATLVLFDADGHVLGYSSATLKPGEATYLDAPFPEAGVATEIGTRPDRISVRGVVLTQRLDSRGFPPDPCRTTLEVFDNTDGKTKAFLSP